MNKRKWKKECHKKNQKEQKWQIQQKNINDKNYRQAKGIECAWNPFKKEQRSNKKKAGKIPTKGTKTFININ